MWRKRRISAKDPNETEDRVIPDIAAARTRTMNRAVKLLAAKPRSVGQLRERLLEKHWTNPEIVDSVIEKLKEYRYLDDGQFAADLASSKLRQRPQGKRRLQQAMSRKHLSKEAVDTAINTAFEKLPEEELILKAIEKRLRLKGKPETREDTKKFYDHLLRLGFEYDLIRANISRVVSGELMEDQ